MNLCLCGCGKEVIKEENKYINGHNQRGKTKENNEGVRRQAEKISKQMIGRNKGNDERYKKISEKLKGRPPSIKGFSKETHKGIRKQAEWMKSGGAIYVSSFVTEENRRKGIKKTVEKITGRTKENYEYLKKRSENMRNGGAARIHKQIKNPSGPELKLRGIVKDLCPTSEHTYKVLNYDVDVALLEYKIAVEYDGYHHFKDQDAINYHNKRQQEIEQEGWKFIRYTMFDKFPSKEKVKEDIQKILKGTK